MRTTHIPLNVLADPVLAALMGSEVIAEGTEWIHRNGLVEIMVAFPGEVWARVSTTASVKIEGVETHRSLAQGSEDGRLPTDCLRWW